MPGIASAATSIVIGHVAGGTSTIRVGAGGIMLPNHSPLAIAEQFGTLESLYPGRIDLGLGRAPGLRRPHRAGAAPQSRHRRGRRVSAGRRRADGVLPRRRRSPVRAVPGAGPARADLDPGIQPRSARSSPRRSGCRIAFASHFAPAQMMQAIEMYRAQFQPSEPARSAVRHARVQCLRGRHRRRSARCCSRRCSRRSSTCGAAARAAAAAVAGFEQRLAPPERAMIAQALSCSAVGSPDTVRADSKRSSRARAPTNSSSRPRSSTTPPGCAPSRSRPALTDL